MSTGGYFVPPTVPECAYAPVMTRAAAIALRNGGGLNVNCVVVVSDGPVIGTAGNTSATTVELQPVSATEFSTAATVNTSFGAGANAWDCIYDIDLGTAGTFIEIRDNQANTVRSTVADAPTVQTQFPWHLAVTGQVRNNTIEESTLTGWGAITTTVRGNQITRNSVVALTGNWGIFTDNRIENGTVSLLHAAGGTRTFSGNTVRGAAVFRTLAGGTGSWTVTDSDFLDGYVFENAAASTATGTVDGSRFEGHGATTIDASVTGSGSRSFNNVRSVTSGVAQQFTLPGTGPALSLVDTDFIEGRVVYAVGATRGLTVSGSTVRGATLSQTRTGGTGVDSVLDSVLSGTGTALTLAGATDPAGAQTVLVSSHVTEGSALTLTNPAGSGGIVVTNTILNAGATVTGTATVLIDRCRFSTGATFTAGAFTHDRSIVDGNLSVTPTASNSGKLANASFNSWV